MLGSVSSSEELWTKRGERKDRREAAELNALTKAIVGAALKVPRELGPGLLSPPLRLPRRAIDQLQCADPRRGSEAPRQRLSGGFARKPSALTAFSALESSLTPSAGVLFPDQLSKPVEVQFDTEAMTSDGGVVLLGALDRGLGLTDVALAMLTDARDPSRVVHSQLDMLRQRIYGLALGYEDCNDSARIAHDPAVKLAVGRGLDEADLASTATLCRFENSVSPRELVNAARTLLKWRLTSLRKRFKKARVVTIDFDSTPDPTHGQQELAFYDGH